MKKIIFLFSLVSFMVAIVSCSNGSKYDQKRAEEVYDKLRAEKDNPQEADFAALLEQASAALDELDALEGEEKFKWEDENRPKIITIKWCLHYPADVAGLGGFDNDRFFDVNVDVMRKYFPGYSDKFINDYVEFFDKGCQNFLY